MSLNPVKRLSHCQCHKLTNGRIGVLERLLILLIPHFDIIKSPAIRSGGTAEVTCYLRRFYLFRAKWFGLEKYLGDLYLHHIIRSDDDPDPHDHPWSFRGFIIAGGYTDESYTWEPGGGLLHVQPVSYMKSVVYGLPDSILYGKPYFTSSVPHREGPFNEVVKPLSFVRRAATHIHRVIVPSGKTAWTIIMTERRSRDWNFITETGPVLWRTYLGIPDGIDVGE